MGEEQEIALSQAGQTNARRTCTCAQDGDDEGGRDALAVRSCIYKLELQQRQSHICVCTWNMYERLAAWDLSTYGKRCNVKVGSSDEGTDVRRGVISLSSSFCWSQFFF